MTPLPARGKQLKTTILDPAAATHGFTLVELIVVLIVVAVVAAISGVLVMYLTKAFIYVPGALAANQAAAEVLSELAEGQQLIPGIRYATEMPVAQDNRLRYRAVDQSADGTIHWIEVWYDENDNAVYRRLDDEDPELIPASPAKGVEISPLDGEDGIFSYFDRDDNQLNAPVDNHAWIVHRVRIGIRATATEEHKTNFPTTSQAEMDIYVSFSR